MPDLISVAPNLGYSAIQAGVNVNQYDLLELGPDNQAYPCQATDSAVVANTNSDVIASTTLAVAAGPNFAGAMPPITIAEHPTTGTIYVIEANSSGPTLGVNILAYSAAGALRGSVVVDTAFGLYNPFLFLTANNNLVIVYTGSTVNYAVYDGQLNVVKALTTIETGESDQDLWAIPLSTGGFCVEYLKSGTQTTRFSVYDNAGVQTLAPTTVATWVGAVSTHCFKMAELSNGNVAFGGGVNFATSKGTYYGVVSTAGSVVVAFTQFDATLVGGNTNGFDLNAFGGFFCFAREVSTPAVKAWVLNNAGVIQGAAYTKALGATQALVSVANDGTNFWLTFGVSTTAFQITKMPTTGTSYVELQQLAATVPAGGLLTTKIERGRLMIMWNNTSNIVYVVLNLTSLAYDTTQQTVVAPTGSNWGFIFSGDFSFVWCQTGAGTATNFGQKKYANIAIIGVALATVAAGGSVPQSPKVNAYKINQLKGTSSKTFNHSATNIPGRTGNVSTYGASFSA